MSPLDMAARLRELAGDKGLKRAIVNGMRRGLTKGKADALRAVRASGVGRVLWLARGRSGTPPLIVTASKVTQAGNSYKSALKEKGMAALIQTGGRTKRHKEQRSGQKSYFHPGSRVDASPHLEHAASVAESAIPTEIEIGIGEAIQVLEF